MVQAFPLGEKNEGIWAGEPAPALIALTRCSASAPIKPSISKSCEAASMALPIMVRLMNHCRTTMMASVTVKMKNWSVLMLSEQTEFLRTREDNGRTGKP